MKLNTFWFWDLFPPYAPAFLSCLFQLSMSFTACCFENFISVAYRLIGVSLLFCFSFFFLLCAHAGENDVPKQQLQLKLNKPKLKCFRICPGHWMSHTLQREAQAIWICILNCCKGRMLCLSPRLKFVNNILFQNGARLLTADQRDRQISQEISNPV